MANPLFGGPRDLPRGSICEPLLQTTTAGKVMLIHQLVIKNEISQLKKELAKDLDLIDGRNSEGMTPLFQAVSCNNLECVQFLVTSGANIDSKDNVGRTPVALAAYQGWHDGLYYLLAKGANCTIADNCGRLPIHAATYFSSENSLEVLLQHLSLQDVNAKDKEGMTALHWAAFHGRAGHVKVLVARKADLLTRDTDGKLPLHWAAQNGSLSSCQEMLQVPDSHNLVNGKDFSGRTPIHLAAAAGQFKVLVELTKVTFVNHASRDNENRTPLHWAAATGHGCCVAHLLRLGADSEAEDCHGATPLQYAQQGHHSVCCKLILEHDPSNPLLTPIPEETEYRLRYRFFEVKKVYQLSVSASADNLQAPHNSRRGSDNAHPAIRLQNGLTNTHRTADASDSEVQEILSDFVDSTATVQVHVEMNGQDEPTLGAGDMVSLLHDVSSWSGLTPPTSPYFLYPSVNGIHSDHDAAGYSSEEDCRYPPQMVLTPVPGSPIPPEDVNHNTASKPPILPRFSFEDQAPVIRPSGAAVPELAPIKSKTMPDRLRLNMDRSNPAKSADPKPSSPSMETHLGPLKVAAKAKQGAIPLSGKPHPRVSPTVPREVVTPDSNDNGKDRLGARKSKVKTDALVHSPVSDNNESDIFRKMKEKRPSAGSTAGQMLPVISDKSSHVTQVTQGSRQDQLDAKKRNRRNPSKNRSIPEDLDVTGGEEADDTVEDTRSVRSIGNSKDKKKKKKVRKVMSWNF